MFVDTTVRTHSDCRGSHLRLPFLQMRMMQHGKVTVLGDTASDHELFMAACDPVMFKPEDIRTKCDAERLKV